MPAGEHRSQTVSSVPCAILSVSDTRTPETDKSGQLIRRLLEQQGHRVVSHQIVPDEADAVRAIVTEFCADPICRVILLTGGTGLSKRDVTYESVAGLLEKKLDGFGELFRMLSYPEVGPAAMLSRAIAGLCRDTAVFSMPGSPGAVRLAMEKLILPELGHVAALLEP